MGKTTIKDVARQAGVSVAAACNALAGKGRMAPATRNRIEKAAQDLHYVPNKAAQGLSRNARKIGFFLPAYPQEVQSLLIKGARQGFAQLAEFNLRPVMEITPPYTDEEEAAALYALAEKADGIIAECSGRPQAAAALRGLCQKMPVVTLVTHPARTPAACRVSVDIAALSRTAAHFLHLLGCQSAFVFYGNRGTGIHDANLRGFQAEAGKNGMRLLNSFSTNDDMQTARRQLAKQLAQGNIPGGIFASSYIAPALCEALRDAGLAGQVKVIGVDLFSRSAACLEDGSLHAVICQNQAAQALRAVEAMADALSGREVPARIRISPTLLLKSNYRTGKEV